MKQSILELTRRLIATPSISPSLTENDVIDILEAELREGGVEILETPLREVGDGRRNLYARVRGKGKACVLMSGHVDTVPIDDYARYASHGVNQEVAFDPDALEKILGPRYGDRYLFGRGALDMKGAVATCATLMKRFAQRPKDLPGEVLFVAVCDEENASAGMLKAGEFLREYRRREGIQYEGFINTDYTSPAHADDPTRFVYSGTIGKLLPAFLVCGRVSHVGEPYFGFPATLLAAAIHQRIELGADLCESVHGEVTPPATALKVEDLKTHYDVQTPRQVHLYYNVFTFERSPRDVLHQMKAAATEAFEETVRAVEAQERRHAERRGQEAPSRGWKPRVLTLEELKSAVAAGGHDPGAILAKALEAHSKADERVAAREAVRALWDHLPDADEPGVVVYLAPPYYPGFATPPDSALGRAVERLVERHHSDLPQLVLRHFYPYISDMSYLAFPESLRSGIGTLEANLPGWGERYRLDLEGIADLDMPVVNLGPVGFDAHKDTERVEIDYSFGILPRLIEELVLETLRGGR
ncbi:MAG: M20/M25/M40 family metallo-hydrolase [Planctomycetota bacterium]